MKASTRAIVVLAVLGILFGTTIMPVLAKEPVPPKSRGEVKESAAGLQPATLPILQRWEGSYPVASLDKLPGGQQKTSAGYIGNAKTFSAVWKGFKPGEKAPKVDFKKNLVVFTRNVKFYNRTAITKVTLTNGTAEILGIETLTSTPVTDRVAMALAEIPRAGVQSVNAGGKVIPVK